MFSEEFTPDTRVPIECQSRRSNFSVQWATERTSLCPSIAQLGRAILWYPRIQNWRDSNPCLDGKANCDAARKPSTLPIRLRRTVGLHGCSGGVYTCMLGYTHPYIRPLLHWARVYTPDQRTNDRQRPFPPSGALCGNIESSQEPRKKISTSRLNYE